MPWFAALLAAQPVLPLLAVRGPAGRRPVGRWCCVGVALLDLAVLWRPSAGGAGAGAARAAVRRRPLFGPPAWLGWLAYGRALLRLDGGARWCRWPVGGPAGTPVLAGAPLLLVALVAARRGAGSPAAGRSGRSRAGLLVPVLAAALLRPVAELRPALLLVAAAAVVALAGRGGAAAARLPRSADRSPDRCAGRRGRAGPGRPC